MLVEITYGLYLLLSIAITLIVSRSYKQSGYDYLLECFNGNKQLARSTNSLLLVGFYLLNLGFIALFLKYGEKPENIQGIIEFLSTKIGTVLVVVSMLHFINMKIILNYKYRQDKTASFGLQVNKSG